MNAENSGGEPDNSANSEAPEAAEEELDKGGEFGFKPRSCLSRCRKHPWVQDR